jgi:hypothetical protein
MLKYVIQVSHTGLANRHTKMICCRTEICPADCHACATLLHEQRSTYLKPNLTQAATPDTPTHADKLSGEDKSQLASGLVCSRKFDGTP